MTTNICGTIIHNYKGIEIKKRETCRYGSTYSFYKIIGVDDTFYTLKDAKQYIDRFLVKDNLK